jgi:hypothetical protein
VLGLPARNEETLESNMNICAIAPLAAAAIVTATMRRGVSLLLAALAALTRVGVFTASAQEDPTNIVADQILQMRLPAKRQARRASLEAG